MKSLSQGSFVSRSCRRTSPKKDIPGLSLFGLARRGWRQRANSGSTWSNTPTTVIVALSDLLPVSEAVELLNQGLQSLPHDPLMLHQLGIIFERKGLDEIAEGYFRESERAAKSGRR